MPTLRSSKVWQIWCLTRFLSILLGTAISKFDTFSSYHIVRTGITKVTNFLPFCTIGISMYQKRILPYFIIPTTFSPQASSPLEHSRQMDGQHSSPPVMYLSNVLKELKCVGSGPVRHRLYLLSSHVGTLAHRISTFYCMCTWLWQDEATGGWQDDAVS